MKVDIAFGVGGIDEVLYYAVRHWLWLAALHQQTLDPQCAVDAAPSVSGPIENDENITRE
jgi:hypothetical protein